MDYKKLSDWGGLSVMGWFCCLYFVGGWLSFGYQYKHMLSGLLCMEVSLVGVLGGVMSMGPMGANYAFFYVLGLGVCESALGLSLLVVFARSYGNDLFKALDCQGC
uniref:NADH-ubiquinone oxidoreductase chain 4L n=1 Tax=Azumapecten farreri TaxID=106299 RepID=B4YYE6_AZUFA|nr:NADH dehydrogenase subunit 4L [Azumapecten farreri]ABQ96653.1 NADH dehydrogenase subunit 4L [Azumapecten farreri]ACD77263.1 NADH dehydrogenase subunit 4L [Azumapecten farreri]ACL36015.1 NADH dehydrogenase subunit 4L [Azumapecten farreri]